MLSIDAYAMGRRACQRLPVESFCSEYRGEEERSALVVDLSEGGLRVQRPAGGPPGRTMQLEFEIPDIDELVWAKGEICFDQIWRARPDQPGLTGLVRTSGIRLVAAANRHLKLLREYVCDTRRDAEEFDDPLESSMWHYRATPYVHW